jgi:hypothetical protein
MWERNTNDSWQSLQNQFGFLASPSLTTAYSIWMATGNPAAVGKTARDLVLPDCWLLVQLLSIDQVASFRQNHWPLRISQDLSARAVT